MNAPSIPNDADGPDRKFPAAAEHLLGDAQNAGLGEVALGVGVNTVPVLCGVGVAPEMRANQIVCGVVYHAHVHGAGKTLMAQVLEHAALKHDELSFGIVGNDDGLGAAAKLAHIGNTTEEAAK